MNENKELCVSGRPVLDRPDKANVCQAIPDKPVHKELSMNKIRFVVE